MTLVPTLPALSVEIAFNPSSLYDLSQTWTECSQHVLDFKTKSGKQHFLDRVEAGTLEMSVNGRTGFFYNGGASPGNASGYVIQARLPIKVTATWLTITYPVFYGIIDSAVPVIKAQSSWEIKVNASDFLKQLSLHKMASSGFWESYANNAATTHWYRCSQSQTAIVTSAVGNGTTVTYQALGNFSVGDAVTILGLTASSGSALNFEHVAIASMIGSPGAYTGFTVTNATVGVSSGTGSAYRTAMTDLVGSAGGYFEGAVSFPQYGAMIYDTDGCVDLCNGGSTPTGSLVVPESGSITASAIDFWILGQGMAQAAGSSLATIAILEATALWMDVNANGVLEVATTSGAATSGIKVDDGYWHHVGVVKDGTYLKGYVDGHFFALEDDLTAITMSPAYLGVQGELNPAALMIDEVVTSSSAITADMVLNRWIAGHLLQGPTNTQQSPVLSGDRIAEILCLAGFGTISAGAIVLNADWYYINNSSTPWVNAASGNGFLDVEPWYWDTPVIDSAALDLILEITDTDIGLFYQRPDGTVGFLNQNYFGTWDPVAETWTPSYTTPTGDHVWTDDGTSDYPYYGPSLQAPRDDADIWTSVKITPQAGVEQIYNNTAAEARWGYTTLEKSDTLHQNLLAALQTAKFLGHLYRDPLPRVDNVELRAEASNGINLTAMLGAAIADPVTFKNTPPGASTSGTYPSEVGIIDTDMVIESIAHEYSMAAGTWRTSFGLDPYPIRS